MHILLIKVLFFCIKFTNISEIFICLLNRREYNFENRQQQTFTDEDIVNMYPIVKHISPRATDAYNFYTTG